MVDRAQSRVAFGKPLNKHGTVGEWIARSRIEIEQARLLVLKAAWMIDKVGAKAARKEISMIALVPTVYTDVCDRAMQVFGAAGLAIRRSPTTDLGPRAALRRRRTRCTCRRSRGWKSGRRAGFDGRVPDAAAAR